jgi:hypothetical protein
MALPLVSSIGCQIMFCSSFDHHSVFHIREKILIWEKIPDTVGKNPQSGKKSHSHMGKNPKSGNFPERLGKKSRIHQFGRSKEDQVRMS